MLARTYPQNVPLESASQGPPSNSNVLAVFQKVTNEIGPRGYGIKPHRGQGIFIREDWFPRVSRLPLSLPLSLSFLFPSPLHRLPPPFLSLSLSVSTFLSLIFLGFSAITDNVLRQRCNVRTRLFRFISFPCSHIAVLRRREEYVSELFDV